MKICTLCGDTVIYKDDVVYSYEYKGHKKDVIDSGLYCKECDELFMDSKDLDKNDKVLKEFRREVDHLLSTQDVKKIRKKIHLTQKEAGVLFGGGVRAFHKYEMGINTQSKPLDILLRLIDREKITVDDIREVV